MSRLEPFKRLAATLKAHFDAVVRGMLDHRRIAFVEANGSVDEVGSGRLLPSISVSQQAASLGTWMGPSSTEQLLVLPDLANFGAAPSLFA